ncbi:hypothetical protein [Streptomyces sp. LN785]|uniref:hypothetical protein n=1 Tax=Streptomyces sp. LN785 TaxID=3112983 RepID=UPI00372391A0
MRTAEPWCGAACDTYEAVLAGSPAAARVAAAVAGLFPRPEPAVQPGAGHFPWLDDPALFSGTVEIFPRG